MDARMVRNDEGIGENVVDIGRPHGPWIAEIVHLDRSSAMGHDSGTRISRICMEVAEDVVPCFAHERGRLRIRLAAHVAETIEGGHDTRTRLAVVVGPD